MKCKNYQQVFKPVRILENLPRRAKREAKEIYVNTPSRAKRETKGYLVHPIPRAKECFSTLSDIDLKDIREY